MSRTTRGGGGKPAQSTRFVGEFIGMLAGGRMPLGARLPDQSNPLVSSVLGTELTEVSALLPVGLEEERSVEVWLLVEGLSLVAVNSGMTTQQ